MKIYILFIIILFVCIICLMCANHQLTNDLFYYKQQTSMYQQAYERVCKQTRVPVKSNIAKTMMWTDKGK